jgi:acyl-CoA synthetase (NDP forming)
MVITDPRYTRVERKYKQLGTLSHEDIQELLHFTEHLHYLLKRAGNKLAAIRSTLDET